VEIIDQKSNNNLNYQSKYSIKIYKRLEIVGLKVKYKRLFSTYSRVGLNATVEFRLLSLLIKNFLKFCENQMKQIFFLSFVNKL
jgi:hypothetical protein